MGFDALMFLGSPMTEARASYYLDSPSRQPSRLDAGNDACSALLGFCPVGSQHSTGDLLRASWQNCHAVVFTDLVALCIRFSTWLGWQWFLRDSLCMTFGV